MSATHDAGDALAAQDPGEPLVAATDPQQRDRVGAVELDRVVVLAGRERDPQGPARADRGADDRGEPGTDALVGPGAVGRARAEVGVLAVASAAQARGRLGLGLAGPRVPGLFTCPRGQVLRDVLLLLGDGAQQRGVAEPAAGGVHGDRSLPCHADAARLDPQHARAGQGPHGRLRAAHALPTRLSLEPGRTGERAIGELEREGGADRAPQGLDHLDRRGLAPRDHGAAQRRIAGIEALDLRGDLGVGLELAAGLLGADDRGQGWGVAAVLDPRQHGADRMLPDQVAGARGDGLDHDLRGARRRDQPVRGAAGRLLQEPCPGGQLDRALERGGPRGAALAADPVEAQALAGAADQAHAGHPERLEADHRGRARADLDRAVDTDALRLRRADAGLWRREAGQLGRHAGRRDLDRVQDGGALPGVAGPLLAVLEDSPDPGRARLAA